MAPAARHPDRGRPLDRRTVLAGLGGATLLGACASETPGGAGKGGDTGTTTVTVVDQRGRRVALPGPARRVVTIPMPAASIIVAVDGGPDHLVGMQSASWTAIDDGVLGEFFPELLAVPHGVASTEFAPNVESVLALRPDLVVQWGDRSTGITAPLENAGLTVLGLSYGTQEDLTTWVTLFATLLGRADRGRRITTAIAASLGRAKATRARSSGPVPTVLYVNRFADALKVAGSGTYNDFCIDLVGARNPASGPQGAGSGMVGVDPEQVLAWDPDVILLGNFDAALPDDLYGDPLWQGLSAVRDRRVYKVPVGGYRWDPPSHESPLMWTWLSEVVFPERPAADLAGEVDRYFDLYYGRRPSARQLGDILRVDANRGSTGYRRFDAP